jgi:hypothetical protein
MRFDTLFIIALTLSLCLAAFPVPCGIPRLVMEELRLIDANSTENRAQQQLYIDRARLSGEQLVVVNQRYQIIMDDLENRIKSKITELKELIASGRNYDVAMAQLETLKALRTEQKSKASTEVTALESEGDGQRGFVTILKAAEESLKRQYDQKYGALITSLAGRISSGPDHSCFLDREDNVVCWGRSDASQSQPPPLPLAAVSCSDYTCCGLSSTGAAVCWGSNVFGKASPPDFSFSAISVGGGHGCGEILFE